MCDYVKQRTNILANSYYVSSRQVYGGCTNRVQQHAVVTSDSYRPISQLSFVSKLVERAVAKRFVGYYRLNARLIDNVDFVAHISSVLFLYDNFSVINYVKDSGDT